MLDPTNTVKHTHTHTVWFKVYLDKSCLVQSGSISGSMLRRAPGRRTRGDFWTLVVVLVDSWSVFKLITRQMILLQQTLGNVYQSQPDYRDLYRWTLDSRPPVRLKLTRNTHTHTHSQGRVFRSGSEVKLVSGTTDRSVSDSVCRFWVWTCWASVTPVR